MRRRTSSRINKGKLPEHLAVFEVKLPTSNSTSSSQSEDSEEEHLPDTDVIMATNQTPNPAQIEQINVDGSSGLSHQEIVSSINYNQTPGGNSSMDEQLRLMNERMEAMSRQIERYKLELLTERKAREHAEDVLRRADKELDNCLIGTPRPSCSTSTSNTLVQLPSEMLPPSSRVHATHNGGLTQSVTVNAPITTSERDVLHSNVAYSVTSQPPCTLSSTSNGSIQVQCTLPYTSSQTTSVCAPSSSVVGSATNQPPWTLSSMPIGFSQPQNPLQYTPSQLQWSVPSRYNVPQGSSVAVYPTDTTLQHQQSLTMPGLSTQAPRPDACRPNAPVTHQMPSTMAMPNYGVMPPYTFMPQTYSCPIANSVPPSEAFYLPQQPPPTMPTAQFSRQKLMELPQFSGDPEQWPAFYTSFRQSTMSFGYSTLDNLYRLQNCLSGAARKLVDPLLVHHQNVERAISSLAFRFGRPEQLAQSQLAKVRLIKPIDANQMEQIIPFASTVEHLVAFLQNGQCEFELTNPSLLAELVRKLPIYKRLEWVQQSAHMVPRATIIEFSNWLNITAQYVTLAFDDAHTPTQSQQRNQLPPQQRPHIKGKNTFLHVSEQDSTHSCPFCYRQHNASDCYQLRNLSTDRRWDEVKNLRLCFSCLTPGHDTADCMKKRRCDVQNCSQFHHPLLHENTDSRRPIRNNSAIRKGRTTAQFAGRSNNNRPDQNNSSDVPSTSAAQSSSNQNKVRTPYVNKFAMQPSAAHNTVKTSCASMDVLTHCREEHNSPLLFRIVPVTLYSRTKQVSTFAMIDEGATVSLIETDLANDLDLVGPPAQLNLQWFGNMSHSFQSNIVAFDISGTASHHRRHRMNNIKTVQCLGLPTQTVRLSDIHSSQRQIKNLPIQEYNNAKPRLLIGLDYSHLAAPIKSIKGTVAGPTVVKTDLGWIIHGRQSSLLDNKNPHLLLTRSMPEAPIDSNLDHLVRDYFTTENFGVKQPERILESTIDARARCILDQTTQRVGDRYQTGLLWCRDDVVLPDSYSMALRRLISVERKMSRDPSYAAMYTKNISEYVAKGYARRLSKSEADQIGPRTWYLPHFGVVNAHKPGKLRMVFDAAACADGVSLNSVLLTGPDLNPALPGILFKFRIGQVAVCGDICEMFHQIVMRPEDRDAQRFLWREGDATRPPDVYEMVAMTFGATCSPAAAQFAKNRNADENAAEFPEAVEPIKFLHYVDDFVASFATPKEAANVTAAVTEVHRRGGFVLRNFVSNNTNVLRALGAPTNLSTISLQPESPTTADRILGMCWDTHTDAFLFQPSFSHLAEDVACGRKPPTKRQVLSIAMSVFDPFGILADYMLHAKLIVQDLWRAGSGWDEPIPAALLDRWTSWFSQMATLTQCRMPRCYSPQLRTSPCVELHVFADASESAFAAVAYWRVQHDNEFAISFIAGKTKCAPLKLLSIPRLELQAAVLATRLTASIREHHKINVTRTVMWSDSKTVLQWIRSDHRRYKPFVAHRIAEVLDETSEIDWRWVPTKLNVADDATRAEARPIFNPKSRWLLGPDFLRKEESEWPAEPTFAAGDSTAPDEEMRSRFIGLIAVKRVTEIINISRFSDYRRLRRTVAWVIRFTSNASSKRRQTARTHGELTVPELNEAELLLCRQAQANSYEEELAALTNNQPVPVGSSVKSLMPYLDEDGTIRIYGRTDAALDAYLSANAKRPVLMPKYHPITNLIIKYYHCRMRHQNDDAVTCAIREQFWVPHLRVAVRRARRMCLICKLRDVRPMPPVMGQLPADRVTPYVRPFTFTGLDFFGPLLVTVGRRQEKRWAALFTCLTVRAVHIELAADLSADACLLCIRNFANIRGVPMRIRSDNGTNFIASSKIVRDTPDFFDDIKMRRELSTLGIEWVFNSPGHPEAGGCWERLVQCVKRVLVMTLNEKAPRVETLRAYLIEAANIVNSRPLTHIPVSPDDEAPMTPNHFLIGSASSTTVPCGLDEKVWCLRKQWRIAQQLSSSFWSKWVNMYLPELTRRTKWHTERPPIKVGDLVIICDSNQSRNDWRRGRVITCFPGPDGRIRNVEVKTSDGMLRRPVSKLAVLDVQVDEPHRTESVHGGGDVAIL